MPNILSDLHRREVVQPGDEPFVPSPCPGVMRLMLDRTGVEVACATSSPVRSALGSHVSAHVHSGGEEFLVLDGTFADGHGTYTAGTYVRNPPGSSHAPESPDGCTLFVKLMQFDPDRSGVGRGGHMNRAGTSGGLSS